MANLCSFEMKVVGKKENIEHFYNALIQEDNIWIGRGADATIEEMTDDGAFIVGYCKWSILSALVDNAISMRNTPERWTFTEEEKESLSFATLLEATKLWDLTMEVYSEEPGIGFQEHFLFQKGVSLLNECVDYSEFYLGEYETKAEAEADLGVEISDDQWGNEYYTEGGYEEWNFIV